jgi:hypothetical protein
MAHARLRGRRVEAAGRTSSTSTAAMTAALYVTPDGLMYVSDWNAGVHVLQYEG